MLVHFGLDLDEGADNLNSELRIANSLSAGKSEIRTRTIGPRGLILVFPGVVNNPVLFKAAYYEILYSRCRGLGHVGFPFAIFLVHDVSCLSTPGAAGYLEGCSAIGAPVNTCGYPGAGRERTSGIPTHHQPAGAFGCNLRAHPPGHCG